MKAVKLLLTDNVDNLGIVGDVVDVRPGYARNFLLPRGLATEPTPGNVQRLAARRAEVEKEMKIRREKLEATFEKVKNAEVTLERSANEQGILFGGISQHEIAQALRDQGHEIEDRMIRIGQQIKRLDSYHVPLVLASDLKTEIKLWIVSDKPTQKQEEEVVEEAPKSKGKKAKAEAQEPAEEKPAEEAKPKKKSKKAAAGEDAATEAKK